MISQGQTISFNEVTYTSSRGRKRKRMDDIQQNVRFCVELLYDNSWYVMKKGCILINFCRSPLPSDPGVADEVDPMLGLCIMNECQVVFVSSLYIQKMRNIFVCESLFNGRRRDDSDTVLFAHLLSVNAERTQRFCIQHPNDVLTSAKLS